MRIATCFVVVALGGTGAACTATVDTGPPVVVTSLSGVLNVDWTINGTTDPNQCIQGNAAALQVTVVNGFGQSVGTFQQSCTIFSTSITLDTGNYSAAAQLIDVRAVARTTTVDINPFTIRGNDSITAPIDFSASSFY